MLVDDGDGDGEARKDVLSQRESGVLRSAQPANEHKQQEKRKNNDRERERETTDLSLIDRFRRPRATCASQVEPRHSAQTCSSTRLLTNNQLCMTKTLILMTSSAECFLLLLSIPVKNLQQGSMLQRR